MVARPMAPVPKTTWRGAGVVMTGLRWSWRWRCVVAAVVVGGWAVGRRCWSRMPSRAVTVTAPLAPKTVNWSSTATPATVVTAQPSAQRTGIVTAQSQRCRARGGSATAWVAPSTAPVTAPMTASRARDVPKSTATAPSRRPTPIPRAVATTQRSRGSRRELARACPAPSTAPVARPPRAAAAGPSTRPTTTRPVMPDSGKATNPAVQSSQARSALRAGAGAAEVGGGLGGGRGGHGAQPRAAVRAAAGASVPVLRGRRRRTTPKATSQTLHST